MARFLKKMGEAVGEDLGEEVEQVLEEAEGDEGSMDSVGG
jgi:hypothetical protein